MMTNNAIKKLSGSLVFTQELSEAELCKWTIPGMYRLPFQKQTNQPLKNPPNPKTTKTRQSELCCFV